MDRRLSDDDDDHPEFTDKGLAYGNGRFVHLMGWGADASFQTTEDGITWERVFVAERFGAVMYSQDRFIASGQRTAYTSTDGLTWTPAGNARAPDHVREGFQAA